MSVGPAGAYTGFGRASRSWVFGLSVCIHTSHFAFLYYFLSSWPDAPNTWLYARRDHPSRSDILNPRRSHVDLRLDGILYLAFPFFYPMQTSAIVLRLAAPLIHRLD